MSPVLRAASYAAIIFCAASAAVQAVPSFATGTTTTPASAVEIVKNDPLIIDANVETTAEVPEVEAEPRTLSALVAAEQTGEDLTAELECLAGAVYFEARSESLDGQLAVADVILNRAIPAVSPAQFAVSFTSPASFRSCAAAVCPRSIATARIGGKRLRSRGSLKRIAGKARHRTRCSSMPRMSRRAGSFAGSRPSATTSSTADRFGGASPLLPFVHVLF